MFLPYIFCLEQQIPIKSNMGVYSINRETDSNTEWKRQCVVVYNFKPRMVHFLKLEVRVLILIYISGSQKNLLLLFMQAFIMADDLY